MTKPLGIAVEESADGSGMVYIADIGEKAESMGIEVDGWARGQGGGEVVFARGWIRFSPKNVLIHDLRQKKQALKSKFEVRTYISCMITWSYGFYYLQMKTRQNMLSYPKPPKK